MSPTVESWVADPSKLGPIYPLVGWELLMFASCVAFSVAFIVWKLNTERAHYRERVAHLQQTNELHRAMED